MKETEDGPPPGWKPDKTSFELTMEKQLSPSDLKKPISKQDVFHFVGTLLDEIKSLRKKITQLESRPHLEYAGTWSETKAYAANKLLTHSGSLWLTTRDTICERPGQSDAYRLIVKRGKA